LSIRNLPGDDRSHVRWLRRPSAAIITTTAAAFTGSGTDVTVISPFV